jgi:hypothetical protein
MAKDDKIFDQFFKEKLENHEVRISQLSWEKLEAKLPSKTNRYKPLWMKIAASLALILGLGYLVFFNSKMEVGEDVNNLVTMDNLEKESTTEIEMPVLQKSYTEEKTAISTKKASIKQEEKRKSDKSESKSISRKNIQEELEVKHLITSVQEKIDVIQLQKELDIPTNMNSLSNNWITEVREESASEEVKYSIKIISNGLKEEPQKPAIINELENKIYKVGTWIGKVDQGFADLQDAKNNLFASITTKSDKKQK